MGPTDANATTLESSYNTCLQLVSAHNIRSVVRSSVVLFIVIRHSVGFLLEFLDFLFIPLLELHWKQVIFYFSLSLFSPNVVGNC